MFYGWVEKIEPHTDDSVIVTVHVLSEGIKEEIEITRGELLHMLALTEDTSY